MLIVCGFVSTYTPETHAAADAGDRDVAPVAVEQEPVPLDPLAKALGLIRDDEIARDIAHLADDAMEGRRADAPGGERAAAWIAEQFREAGLQHLARDSPEHDGYFHPIPGSRFAPNVVGVRPAHDGEAASRAAGDPPSKIILITAHYDHLGIDENREGDANVDRIYNGADDNASGVAGILAIARATRELKLPVTLIFVAFSAEELGLRGARHMAGSPPFDTRDVLAMFNMDMISRGEPDLIFVVGSQNSGDLRRALSDGRDQIDATLRIEFDKHADWLYRSDQGPFARRGVPAVLLSVEDHADYHQVSDHADKVLPDLAARTSRLVLKASALIAGRGESPRHE
jgi:Zn-dependent M28 family amino/carboxypeptidase